MKVKGMIKLLMVLSLVLTLVNVNENSELNSSTDILNGSTQETAISNDASSRVLEGEVPTPEYRPENLEPGHDGYRYVKAGSVLDPRTGKNEYQMWSYSNGNTYRGWTAYVADGSKTLFLAGDLENRLTLGVGNYVDSTTYIYKPAKFHEGMYTGNIIDVQGSVKQSVLLTDTGEIWYTGQNDSKMFRDNNAIDYSGMHNWNKFELPATAGKVVDIALAADTLFYVTDNGRLYLSGRLAYDDNHARNPHIYNNRYLKTAHSLAKVHSLNITEELAGEVPKRLYSQRSTREYGSDNNSGHRYYERWVIVGTDRGYLGSGYDYRARIATGIGGNQGDVVGREYLHSNESLGFLPVNMQKRPPGGYTRDREAAPLNRVPAGFMKDFEAFGTVYLSHFVGADGKIYTSGRSEGGGNVSGTKYRHFRGWNSGYTDINTGNPDYVSTSGDGGNRWTTNVFAENDSWGDDNKEIYPGALTMAVEKTDGRLIHVSEIIAGGGIAPKTGPNTWNCLPHQYLCITNIQLDINNVDADDAYYYSTNWNKTEKMNIEFMSGLWNGSMAVDQDGYLRIASRGRAQEETAAKYHLIYPVVTPESTIRTETLAGGGLTNAQYATMYDYGNSGAGYFYNNRHISHNQNVRVVGEFMLLDQVHIEKPSYKFDGTKVADDEGASIVGTSPGSYDPLTVEIGPTYSNKYMLDKNPSDYKPNTKIYLSYEINRVDPMTGSVGELITSEDNYDITDEEKSVDLSVYNSGWYVIKATRKYTTPDGLLYESATAHEYFHLSNDVVLNVPPVVNIDENTVLPYNIAKGATATAKRVENLNDHIFISRTSIPKGDLGVPSNRVVNTGSGVTGERTYDISIAAINEYNTGVHSVDYMAYSRTGESALASQTVVVNDGTFEIGEEYIIQAKDFSMSTNEFKDGDRDLISASKLKLWKKNENGVFEQTNDYSNVIVDKDGWKNEEGIKVNITFSARNSKGEIDTSQTVVGSMLSSPVFSGEALTRISLGEAFNPEDGKVKAVDAEDGEYGYDNSKSHYISYISNVNTEVAGVYRVRYAVTDSNGNISTFVRVVIVDDGTITYGESYALQARSFAIDYRLVNLNDKKGQVKKEANTNVYDIKTGEKLGNSMVTVEFGNPEYSRDLGSYTVNLSVYENGKKDVEKNIIANVYNPDTTDSVGNVGISASNIVIDVEQAKTLNAAKLAELSKVDAFTILPYAPLTPELTVDSVKLFSTVNTGKVDVYNFVYTATDGKDTTKKDVFVTVKDGNTVINGDEMISAVDFTMTTTEVENKTEDLLKTKARVVAKNISTGKVLKVSAVENIQPEVGQYPVKFVTESNTSIDVTADVHNKIVVDPITGESMAASYFKLTSEEAANLTEEQARDLSKVKAWNTATLEPVGITTTDISKVGTKIGSYDVIFGTAKGTKITVQVLVGDEIDIVGGYAISAKDVVFDEREIRAFNGSRDDFDSEVLKRSDVRAWVIATNTEVTPVVVETTNINVNKPVDGVYEVKYRLNSYVVDLSTIRNVTVISSDIDLSARSATISPEEAKTMSLSKLNELTNVYARKKSDANTPVDFVLLDEVATIDSIKSGVVGPYVVTYEANDGITTKTLSVVISVVPEGTSENETEILVANDFSVLLKNAVSLTDAAVIDKANARAWNKMTGESVNVFVKENNIVEQVGTYNVLLSTESGLEKNVKANVQSTIVVDPITGESMSASYFTLSLEEAANLTAEDAIEKANVKAWNSKTLEPVAVTGADISKVKDTPGSYNVKFTTAKGTSITVQAIVGNSIEVINGYAIAANDITFAEEEIIAYNGNRDLFNKEILVRSAVRAWIVETGTEVQPIIVNSDNVDVLTPKQGSFDVKYSLTNSNVQLSTYAKLNVIVSDIELTAYGATVTPAEAKTMTAAKLNELTDVQAKKISDSSVPVEFEMVNETNTIDAIRTGVVGPYLVTYKATDGKTTETLSVVLSVVPGGTVESDDEVIIANDFSVSVSETTSLTNTSIKSRANAKAWNKHTGERVEVYVERNNIIGTIGAYTVVFSTEKDLEITVNANVYSGVIDNKVTGEVIVGNNFEIMSYNVEKLNVDLAVAYANARAWKTESGESVKITTADLSAVVNRPGIYSLTLKTDKGTELPILATVIRAEVANVVDSNFRTCINSEYLDKGNTELIYVNELEAIEESVDCAGRNISDITGAKHLTGISELDLNNNKIEDVSDLENLDKLTHLNLEHNKIKDVSSLSRLKYVSTLKLSNNMLVDVSKLNQYGNLTSLEVLTLGNQEVILEDNVSNSITYKQKYKVFGIDGQEIKYNESTSHKLLTPGTHTVVNTWNQKSVVNNLETQFDGIVKENVTRDLSSVNKVKYRGHVQQFGWQDYVKEGESSGTFGQALRIESFQIELDSGLQELGSIQYKTHIQRLGWEDAWKKDNEISGTYGKALRIEAFEIKLTGELANQYDVYYRTHIQNFGWLGWASNGERAGSSGFAYRMEAIEIRLIEKNSGEVPPTNPYFEAPYVMNDAYGHTLHTNGASAGNKIEGVSHNANGTSIERIKMDMNYQYDSGQPGITSKSGVKVSIKQVGDGWKSSTFDSNNRNHPFLGTPGKYVHGIKFELTGQISKTHKIYYRVHVRGKGWLGWAENGQLSGSELSGLDITDLEYKITGPEEPKPENIVGGFTNPSY